MYICLSGSSVRLSVCVWVVNFWLRDNSKEVARIALKFCMDICICVLKNPIDFCDRSAKNCLFWFLSL